MVDYRNSVGKASRGMQTGFSLASPTTGDYTTDGSSTDSEVDLQSPNLLFNGMMLEGMQIPYKDGWVSGTKVSQLISSGLTYEEAVKKAWEEKQSSNGSKSGGGGGNGNNNSNTSRKIEIPFTGKSVDKNLAMVGGGIVGIGVLSAMASGGSGGGR